VAHDSHTHGAATQKKMNFRHAAALALLSFLLAVAVCPEAAVSGVIIEKKATQVVNPGDGKCPWIEIIQGHKLRTGPMVPEELGWSLPSECRGTWAVVDDLDKNIETSIDYEARSYYQKTFIEDEEGLLNTTTLDKWKATGKHRKIAGYWCEGYEGSGESAHWGHMIGTECVAQEAPGLAEYNEFAALLDKMNAENGFGKSYAPKGVVLQNMEDCCAGPAEWVVTKIQSKPIPAKFFEPPAGFVKTRPPKG
jgi:hypothetical protein